MPWTVANPPPCAKNWTDAEKKKCVEAANAVLREGGEEQDAIFACIRNAGKTEHPGGEEKSLDMEHVDAGVAVDEVNAAAAVAVVAAIKAAIEPGGPDVCICPECGHKIEKKRGVPCRQMECPECGTSLVAGGPQDGEKEEGNIEDKAGRRVQGVQVSALETIMGKFNDLVAALSGVIDWAKYADTIAAVEPDGTELKTFVGKDGRMWLCLATMNAYKDREQEIFETKAIEEYVERHADDAVKGKFDFWHIPGSEFATIAWQGVSGRFLYELAPFDDTETGRVFAKFFKMHPLTHPVLAPEGWGASHEFKYLRWDRLNGVYRWFEKLKSTVLPLGAAANVLTGMEVVSMGEAQKMSAEQVIALRQIGKDTGYGGDKLVELIEKGAELTETLDAAGVESKSLGDDKGSKGDDAEKTEHETTEGGDDGETGKGEGEGEGEEDDEATESMDVQEVVEAVVEALQLKNLSTSVIEILDAVKELTKRVDTLEESDEERLAEKGIGVPNFAWFRASAEKSTVVGDDDKLAKSKPKVPAAVTGIADAMEHGLQG